MPLTAPLRILPLLLVMTAGTAQAHFYPETANCRAPKKPFEFITELDKQQFDAKVAEYRSCLEGFVNKQNEAMAKHQASADKAAATWKQYVETVLGATLQEPGQEDAETAPQPAQ